MGNVRVSGVARCNLHTRSSKLYTAAVYTFATEGRSGRQWIYAPRVHPPRYQTGHACNSLRLTLFCRVAPPRIDPVNSYPLSRRGGRARFIPPFYEFSKPCKDIITGRLRLKNYSLVISLSWRYWRNVRENFKIFGLVK